MGIILGVIILTLFIFLGIQAIRNAHKVKLPITTRQYIRTEWFRINKDSEHTPLQAVIEADKLLEFVLKELEFPGKTTQERLDSAEKIFANYEDLCKARRQRNRIAHQLNYKPSDSSIQRTLDYYHTAFASIGLLDRR